ncbi:MAG: hypothetical protein AVDCRST_MAG50-2684, partial [uncultured Acidimicrobiales bacterium]
DQRQGSPHLPGGADPAARPRPTGPRVRRRAEHPTGEDRGGGGVGRLRARRRRRSRRPRSGVAADERRPGRPAVRSPREL